MTSRRLSRARSRRGAAVLFVAAAALFLGSLAGASSHSDAPAITDSPKVDATDFYMFRSYETGRSGFVTLIADFIPLQDPNGGPNYFTMDPEALYEIHVDNDGDADEDLTFRFRFHTENRDLAIDVGDPGNTVRVPVPFVALGPVSAVDASALNVEETYTVDLIQGDRRTGVVSPITRQGGGTFTKPLDNVGAKTIPDYAAYAASHVYDVSFPTTAGCGGAVGKIFVGQRREGFHMNLGEVFDLINGDFDPGTPAFDLLGPQDQAKDALVGKNVTSICIEIPSHCLRTNTSPNPVIGGWATASKRQVRVLNPSPDLTHKPTAEGGAWTQVSRVGMPLVDQLMIGLRDKDRFDSSEPLGDAQFATYFTHPTFPEIMEIFFGGSGIQAPNLFPRVDLVDVFLEGITGLNAPASVQPSEMLRLNLDVAPVEASFQDSLGHLAGDSAGFPNGRRPGDDVVDILWRLLMGARLPSGFAPSGGLPFVDGAFRGALSFDSTFPYLQHPLPGSPQ